MADPIYFNMTGRQSDNKTEIDMVEHITVPYVDDSTNLISCTDNKILQEYINKCYILVESYYNINF